MKVKFSKRNDSTFEERNGVEGISDLMYVCGSNYKNKQPNIKQKTSSSPRFFLPGSRVGFNRLVFVPIPLSRNSSSKSPSISTV